MAFSQILLSLVLLVSYALVSAAPPSPRRAAPYEAARDYPLHSDTFDPFRTTYDLSRVVDTKVGLTFTSNYGGQFSTSYDLGTVRLRFVKTTQQFKIEFFGNTQGGPKNAVKSASSENLDITSLRIRWALFTSKANSNNPNVWIIVPPVTEGLRSKIHKEPKFGSIFAYNEPAYGNPADRLPNPVIFFNTDGIRRTGLFYRILITREFTDRRGVPIGT